MPAHIRTPLPTPTGSNPQTCSAPLIPPGASFVTLVQILKENFCRLDLDQILQQPLGLENK
jgi:hypothetical protein